MKAGPKGEFGAARLLCACIAFFLRDFESLK